MVDNLEIKFKELKINVEKEHDLAFIQDVLEEEANGLAIDDDVCGMMLDLCYTKARDLLVEAKNFAHYSERDDIEVEDLDICKDQRGEDLCDSESRIRRSKALVNRYPIILPNNDSGMILPSWRNCQIGADARLKGAFVKPSKTKGNMTNETDTLDLDDDDDLIHLMDIKKELFNSSSTSTSTDSGDTTDNDIDRDSGNVPTAPKKRKLDEPSTPISAARKLKKTSGFPESYVPLKSSRSPPTLSAATASALEFALMRKPPPPKMQKVSRSKPKKLKLDPQLIKGGGSTGGGGGGGGGSSSKSKSKQTTGKSKGSPKLNTDAEKSKQTNVKNDATSKTLAKGSKPIASTKKTTTGPTATNDKKGNASNATATNDKSLDNANPTIDKSVGVGFRLPKINIIQNFKRDPRGPRSRRKR